MTHLLSLIVAKSSPLNGFHTQRRQVIIFSGNEPRLALTIEQTASLEGFLLGSFNFEGIYLS
jgi:hypothetical protein